MTNEEFIKSISLEGEIWKDIPDYKGLYMVSNKGRVLSLGRISLMEDGRMLRLNPKILNPQKTGVNGYYRVNLRKEGITNMCNVHRLVAQTYIPNPFNKPYIDHIDTNKTNNNVENLRWCTAKENMNNPLTVNQAKDSHKDFQRLWNLRSVVSLKEGVIIKKYNSIKEVSLDNYSPDCVWLVCNGKNKSHQGLRWMYLEDYTKSLVNQ